MNGTVGLRLAATAITLMAALGVDAGVASAQTAAPYFGALPASGATQLQTARYGAVAAALPNGQVLIAGGDGTSGILQNAEIFDPAGDTFTSLASSGATELQTPRYEAVAAGLPDGQVLIAGGYNDSSGYLATAELFNPAADTFTSLASSGASELQTARAGAAAAALPDGQILIAGGYNGNTGYLASAELFNPATGTFTALPASGSTELQTARAGAVAATLPDGQVLIAGGENGSGALQSAELFNPATDTFTPLPASGATELEAPRAGAVAAELPDGQVLIAGGGNPPAYEQDAELFNPSDDTFTPLPASGGTEPTSERAQGVGVSLPDGQVLIAGGVGLSGILQSAELYNSAPEAAVAAADFGDQTVGHPSALQSLMVTNVGAQPLTVSGAALAGTGNPADFAIIADTCVGETLTVKQSCTITAQFTPSAAEPESATIDLSDNEPTPSTITLSGTGVAAPAAVGGAPAPTGPVGAVGAAGATSSQGSQASTPQIELVTCRTVTKTSKVHGHEHTVTVQLCTTKLISGIAMFGTTTAKATLTRHGVVYATGTARLALLTLHARRPLRAGEYTLTLTRQLNHHRVQTRRELKIG